MSGGTGSVQHRAPRRNGPNGVGPHRRRAERDPDRASAPRAQEHRSVLVSRWSIAVATTGEATNVPAVRRAPPRRDLVRLPPRLLPRGRAHQHTGAVGRSAGGVLRRRLARGPRGGRGGDAGRDASATVHLVARTGCHAVTSYTDHWLCLFPQHGPGKKHTRHIELAPWQSAIVADHPGRFLRGLFHSDGCRVTNWARPRHARHPVRRSRHGMLSVSTRVGVAALDLVVGPKY
jgi:hypothetical protein